MPALHVPLTQRRALWLLGLGLTACALPDGTPTGIEMTWTLEESVPGSIRERTCRGASVEQVRVSVTDLDRSDRFTEELLDCEEGRSEPSDAQVRAPEVFFELRPGSYAVTMEALGRRTDGVWLRGELRDAMVSVDDEQPTPISLELSVPLRQLSLRLENASACSTLRTWLYYEDAAENVIRLGDDKDPQNVLYRSGLAPSADSGSDTPELEPPAGPILDGTPISCALLSEGSVDAGDLSYEIDAGRYLLDLIIDDQPRCRVPVEVGRDGATRTYLTLDLAQPPC